MHWTREDQRRALEEGWGVFNAGTSGDPDLQIQRLDSPSEADVGYDEPRFQSDEEARRYVRSSSSALCHRALQVVGA